MPSLKPPLKKGRVGRSSPKLTHKSNDEAKKTAVSKRTTGKRKITSDPAKGSVKDDDDEHVQPAKKQKGRKTQKSPKEMKKRNVKEEDTDEVELVVEEFSCPHCNKKFKSQPGCKYHVGEFLTYMLQYAPFPLCVTCIFSLMLFKHVATLAIILD
jgi:hypothetical protein